MTVNSNYLKQWNLTPGVDRYDNEVDVSVTLVQDDCVIIQCLNDNGDTDELILNVQDLINLVQHGRVL